MKTKNVFCLLIALLFCFSTNNLFSQDEGYDISWIKHDVIHGSWKIFCSEQTLPADEDGWVEYTLDAGNVYLVGFYQDGNQVTHPSYEFSVGYNTSGIEMFGNGFVDRLNLSSTVAKSNDKLKMERKGEEMIYYINGEEKFRAAVPAKELKAHFFYPFDAPTFISAKSSFSSFTDMDNDGFSVEVDCDDNDATVGGKKIPGTSCDDGNMSTLEDQIQADSCMCMGIPLIVLGCVPPSEPRIVEYGPYMILMDWTPITEVSDYTIQIRYKGDTEWAVTRTLEKTDIFVRAPRGSYEYRLKSNCDNDPSEYSDIYEFTIAGSLITNSPVGKTNEAAQGRSNDQSIPQIVIPAKFKLSPNPVASELTLNYPEVRVSTKLVVFNYTGKKVVADYQLPINSESSQINVSNLKKGFYFISIIEQGRTVSTKKFIKL